MVSPARHFTLGGGPAARVQDRIPAYEAGESDGAEQAHEPGSAAQLESGLPADSDLDPASEPGDE